MIQAAVDQLLALKAEFKVLTGTDYGPPPVAKPVEEKVVDRTKASLNDMVDCLGSGVILLLSFTLHAHSCLPR